MNVIHTALWVSDLEQTTEFYEGVLGLEYQSQFTGDDGVVNYYVGTEDGAELQFKHDPDDDGAVSPEGIDHVAFSVDDTDAEFERIVDAADPAIVAEPMTVEAADARVAFLEDPDGYVVELVQSI
ncbi:VOC family protein [Natronorubrum sp. JWXQ-INN-674]|uniref:VOC family protein n=1 Tax=Natronorubrum halalkaliphilum TaxID=2691917 RepID=A0A6B0VN46_9EURY|nr:VOC family protein [Natronorubrum halalkaliphilum]MXV62615.1 VOC family protein [Natronorubrum halalkaliphilum]